jgi:hypothetical protein
MPSLVNLQALLDGAGHVCASRVSAVLLVESGGIRGLPMPPSNCWPRTG